MNAIKLLIAGLLCVNVLAAQYVLDETGAMGGFGISPSGSPIQTGAGGNLSFFWTHFNCGKAYGYHLTAGMRYLGYQVKTDSMPDAAPLQDLAGTIGAAFKFRMKNYHRKTETAFLIGPGISWHPGSGEKKVSGGPIVKTTSLVTEAQFAIWWKKDLSKHQTLFISPGICLPMAPVFEVSGSSGFSPAYIYLNAGFSWWNNK